MANKADPCKSVKRNTCNNTRHPTSQVSLPIEQVSFISFLGIFSGESKPQRKFITAAACFSILGNIHLLKQKAIKFYKSEITNQKNFMNHVNILAFIF